MTESTPLIFTTKGNLPIDSLEYTNEWRITPEQIVFIETYTLDGEVVKQSAHVYVLTGATSIGEATI
jgi:hypothetical protein